MALTEAFKKTKRRRTTSKAESAYKARVRQVRSSSARRNSGLRGRCNRSN